jgi:hypothetical protein
MPNSQNLLFSTVFPIRRDDDGPPGEELVTELHNELLQRNLTVEEPDNWRDCGWSVICREGDSTLEIILGQTPDECWLLQIVPFYLPGFLGRLLDRKPSARPEAVHRLALVVHEVLSTKLRMTKSRWRWDGFPDEKSGSALPDNP